MENNLRSILILRFSSIGDIVHSTSVIETLKSYFPDSSIDFMTLSKFAPLVQNHPKINKVFLVDINDGYFALRKIGLSIQKNGYDLVIDLHNSTRSRIILSSIRSIKKLRLPKLYSCSKLYEIFHKNLEIVKWQRESHPHIVF